MDEQAAQAGAALTGGAECREQYTAQGQGHIGFVADDCGIVATQFEDGPGKTGGSHLPDHAAHRGTAGSRNERNAAVRTQCCTNIAAPLQHLRQPFGRVFKFTRHALENCLHRNRRERRFFRRLPDHAVATHQGQRGVPRPHRNRKVERRNHQRRPQRMPAFQHPVPGSFAGNGQPI